MRRTQTALLNKSEEVKLPQCRRDVQKTNLDKIGKVTEMSLEQQNPLDASAQQRANRLIRLIRKLRWMGLEEEAARVQTELAQCGAEPTDSVLTASRETD